jgi:hypothetical protein
VEDTSGWAEVKASSSDLFFFLLDLLPPQFISLVGRQLSLYCI